MGICPHCSQIQTNVLAEPFHDVTEIHAVCGRSRASARTGIRGRGEWISPQTFGDEAKMSTMLKRSE
jgi:hypothetical protein